MAATEILPVADTAADSADVPVVAGEPITVALKGAAIGALVYIGLKDDAGAYQIIGRLEQIGGGNVVTISGPGTYRFSRLAGAACGVFRA